MIELEFVSALAAPASDLWASITTMTGVNYELGPWMQMSYPREVDQFSIAMAPIGEVLFPSWVKLAGVPIDRHFLRLVRVTEGVGFREESTSWSQRRWVHERTITPRDETSCTILDHLELTPRVAWMTPLLVRVVKRVFHHRHEQLRTKFGVASP